jgi:hypothetical protein
MTDDRSAAQPPAPPTFDDRADAVLKRLGDSPDHIETPDDPAPADEKPGDGAATPEASPETGSQKGPKAAGDAAAQPTPPPPANAPAPGSETRERALQAERLRQVEQIDGMIRRLETEDPVLAEARRTDWARLQRENPAAFAERFAAVSQRVDQLGAMRGERARIAAEAVQTQLRLEDETLARKLPEWGDPDRRRALGQEIGKFLQQAGFSQQEIAGIRDHRVVMLLRDAMQYRQETGARKAAEAKRVAAPPPARVQRPGPADAAADTRATRLERLRRSAERSGKLDDRAAYVLAALKDG